jgi:hypothetical protein
MLHSRITGRYILCQTNHPKFANNSPMPKAILQIKVFLSGERSFPDPGIYRTLQIPNDLDFYQLHCILQLAMGWTNSHCHEFRDLFRTNVVFNNMTHYQEQDMPQCIDSRSIKIKDYLKENAFMIYVYDMGDYWLHGLFVEKVISPLEGQFYPICIEGAGNCPPEDCGGVGGYFEMAAILKRKKGELYHQYVQWLGEEYNSQAFHLEETNSRLADWKKVCRRWEGDTF